MIGRIIQFRIILFILPIILYTGPSSGQQLTCKTGLYTFFDNREYFNNYANDQTIFGTRVFAQGSVKIDEKNEFVIGLDGIYEFGSTFDGKKIEPILYIHHNNKAIDLYMGSFYRYPLIELANVLLNDTLQYYKPNIQGIYLAYNKNRIHHNIWIDWTSRQTLENKEVFVLGGSGSLSINKFFYKHDFVFTHYALTSKLNSGEHIRDNGGIYSRLGINISGFSIFDSLVISSGIVYSYDRTRNVTPLSYNKGSLTELYMQHKSFAIRYKNYTGNGQNIITGDPLYKAKFYNRLDLIWKIFNYPGIQGEVEISFHLINDIIDYSQKFTLRAELEHAKSLKRPVD